MASCSLVEDDQCFWRAHGLNNEGDLMEEAVRTFETSVCFNETTQRHNPEVLSSSHSSPWEHEISDFGEGPSTREITG
jgi:hypothetical protein